MKKIIFLLLISILIQSCSSYKPVEFNNIVVEKKRKFEIEKLDSSKLTGRLISKNVKIQLLSKIIGDFKQFKRLKFKN